MWVFIPEHGFISTVVHRDNPNRVIVRARKREHLESLFPEEAAMDMYPDPDGDYRWKLPMWRHDYARRIYLYMSNQMDHTNFKSASEQHHDDPDYIHALHDVWGVMYDYQESQTETAQ